MNVKNIIFDLGGVLVGLDPQRCIKAFGQVGCPQVARYVAEHSVTDLFLEAELGHITQTQFCDEVRRICQCDTADADIVWAWNRLLTSISDERKQRLLQLRRSGCTLYLLSNTNVMHWQYCRDHLFPYRQCQVGDYFKHVFLSYEMHMCKPTPTFSVRCLTKPVLKPPTPYLSMIHKPIVMPRLPWVLAPIATSTSTTG